MQGRETENLRDADTALSAPACGLADLRRASFAHRLDGQRGSSVGTERAGCKSHRLAKPHRHAAVERRVGPIQDLDGAFHGIVVRDASTSPAMFSRTSDAFAGST
jgi:hypothetical protein